MSLIINKMDKFCINIILLYKLVMICIVVNKCNIDICFILYFVGYLIMCVLELIVFFFKLINNKKYFII